VDAIVPNSSVGQKAHSAGEVIESRKGGRRGCRRPPVQMTRYARLDKAIAGSGIFRQVGERAAKSLPQQPSLFGDALNGIRIPVEHNGRLLTITSAYHLGVDDLAIYLALCAVGGLVHSSQTPQAQARKAASRAPERLLEGGMLDFLPREVAAARLQAHGDEWAAARYITYRTTRHTVLTEAGLSPNGSAYRRLTDSLQRLHAVTYTDHGPIGANSTRITSGECLLFFSIDDATEEMEVMLSARLSRAILEPGYVDVSMEDARNLSEPALLLLVRLCNLTRISGDAVPLEIDDLADLIYGSPLRTALESPEDVLKTQNLRRVHRARAKAALREIGALPLWSIGVGIGEPRYWITRLSKDDIRDGNKPRFTSPRGASWAFIKPL
jgi:Replication protein C (RepC)